MATGGEVPGHKPSSGWAEDLDNIKCQPCLEDGQLHEAIGICVDCDDYLCSKCFEHHTLPRPCRNHKLVDKDQMKSKQIRASRKDMCTEKCSVHEDEITKYYCTKHRLLGCTVCITLGGHSTCENVRYIPHVAKELANNAEYTNAEIQLKSALETFNKVCENVEKSSEELEASCADAVKSIKEYRRSADEALNKSETELIETIQKLKTDEMKKLEEISGKNKAEQDELKSRMTKIDALQNANQNCSLYIEMMRSSEMLSDLQSKMKDPAADVSNRKVKVTFSPNKAMLNTLKLTKSFGKVNNSGQARSKIGQAQHVRDINVHTDTDTTTCAITGSVLLDGTQVVLVDYHNRRIKLVDTRRSKVLSELQLSSAPWDITNICSNKVAVTLKEEKKVIIVTVTDSSMTIDRTLTVDGYCWGIDFRNDKLAVSFASRPYKVQILDLQGSVLNEIASDKFGKPIFSNPQYLTFGLDEKMLYVSNRNGNTITCVKLDGSVVATYTDNALRNPLQPWVDSTGDVLVCSRDSNSVHQITSDCKKIRELLPQTAGLSAPYSICHNDNEDTIIVGMDNNNIVKMYTLERDTK